MLSNETSIFMIFKIVYILITKEVFVICNHFVGNIESKNPNSPIVYIPTLFPDTYKMGSLNELQKNDIHNCYKTK